MKSKSGILKPQVLSSPHHELMVSTALAGGSGNKAASDFRHAKAKTDPNRRKRSKGRS